MKDHESRDRKKTQSLTLSCHLTKHHPSEFLQFFANELADHDDS